MFRQILLVCSAAAASPTVEQQSLLQAVISSDGTVGVSTDVDNENALELSQMHVEHHLDGDNFHLAVHHPDGSHLFALEEYKLFGEGIRSFGDNGTMTLVQPSFRSFKATDGPLVRTLLNENGRLHGWMDFKGQLLQFRKEKGATVTTVSFLADEMKKGNRKIETKLHKPNEEITDDVWFKEHQDEHFDEDSGLWWSEDQGCIGDDCEDSTTGINGNHPGMDQPPEITSPVDGDDEGDDEDQDMDGEDESGQGKGKGKGKGRGKREERRKRRKERRKNKEKKQSGTALLQTDQHSMWTGTKWYPGCYDGDNQMNEMKIGVLVDRTAAAGDDWNQRRGYQYNGDRWDSELAFQFEQSNVIYMNQMNIELKIGFSITYGSESAAPNFFRKSYCPQSGGSGYGINPQLMAVKKFVEEGLDGKADKTTVASTHMFTGCNPSGYGTVGLAWVNTLCNGGYATGVNHINAGWNTFAHELGHNFGADHSFEDGQGRTGGIMDYGDGLLNGAYQFNTKYRKSQVCGRLKTAVGRCSNYNGAFEPGSSNSPPRRRRVPARRRSPPRRRRAPVPSPSPSPGGCVDKTNTNIRLNGQIASCQQLSNFCAGYTFVRDACPKTCGVCGSSQPSPTPRPTPQPTRRPTPRPTPSPPPPGGCTDVQSPGNCQYWKSQGFCESSSRYAGYMSSNCCGTCSGDGGGDSGSGGGGSSGGCTERKSVSLDCGICRETAQCKDGGFCCPFMKRCVTSSSQSCSYPIADCRPTCSQANCNTCRPSNGKSYSEWGKPTCGLLLEVPPLPLDVDE